MRGKPFRRAPSPDYASLHPGYDFLAFSIARHSFSGMAGICT